MTETTSRSSLFPVAASAAILVVALSAAAGADVFELGQYAFQPRSVVPDGAGGALLLATIDEKAVVVRLDAEGQVEWAKRASAGWMPALVPLGSGAALVSWDRGGGVRAFRVDMDGTLRMQRHYASEKPLTVTAAAGGADRVVMAMSAGQESAIVIFDEDLGAVRQFGFHHIPQRVVESVFVMPDGGAVFAGTDRGACFVGRIDSKGAGLWTNRYLCAGACGCTHVAASGASIVAGGWTNRQEEIVVLVLETDGRVRHARTSRGNRSPAAFVASGDHALVVTERVGVDVATLLTRFDLERGEAIWSGGLVRDPAFHPWGVAAAANGEGELLFAVIDRRRAVFVANVESAPETCGRFAPATSEWARTEIRSEPLALGVSGIDIVQGVDPPPDAEEIPIRVDRCTK